MNIRKGFDASQIHPEIKAVLAEVESHLVGCGVVPYICGSRPGTPGPWGEIPDVSISWDDFDMGEAGLICSPIMLTLPTQFGFNIWPDCVALCYLP
ncbi:hypothetical protein ES705_14325 [subsurface metagenome]